MRAEALGRPWGGGKRATRRERPKADAPKALTTYCSQQKPRFLLAAYRVMSAKSAEGEFLPIN